LIGKACSPVLSGRPFGRPVLVVSIVRLIGLSLMSRYSLAFLLMFCSVLLIGCGSKEATSGFDKDELAKYAEENPLPYIGGDGEKVEEIQ
jgi:hypothetical protein